MTLSSCYWSLWESVHPVTAPSHLPGTSLDPEASLGLLAKVGSCAGVKSVWWFCQYREGSWPFRMAVCTPSVTRPPHIRFSDAVCLVALFPLKLSSAACPSPRPPSPCVDLCMLPGLHQRACAGQFIGNVPSKAYILPVRDSLRPGLHVWPSVPGFALRSTGL